MKTLNLWWFYALLSAFFAALTAVFAKIGLKGINPDLATAVRTVVILVLSWIIVFAKNGISNMSSISGNNLMFLIFSGIATGLSWIFYFRALHMGKVSYVASIDKTSIVMAILLSLIFLNETITLKLAIGAALIIIGAIIIVL